MTDTAGAVADPRVLSAPALELKGITAGYGRTVVLRDLSLDVPSGQVVALLGPNGVGKTTVLRIATGLLAASQGSVLINGVDVSSRSPHERAKAGLCLIPEGRGIFRNLSVAENLRLQLPPWADRGASFAPAIEAFPVLGARLNQRAGSLSGGEQQMLALARAYLSSPSIVLLDEVSMGLAPILVNSVFAAIRKLASLGVTLLVVEQYVNRALDVADKIVLLDKGSIAFAGPASGLDQKSLVSHYLGRAEQPDMADGLLPHMDR
jgi:branched-chain amino acid transport system ATP-binding protein